MFCAHSDLLTKAEAAAYLHVTVRWITRALAEKRLPKYKVGRHVRVDRRDVDAFLKRSRVEADQ